ncbi:mitochondrial metalloendopeptidase OMA1-like [Dioscorea cayenensis subsp. rotundata]|uniref:Mitochondrial metalloendopeptidase OMA1-like n=1 Tax=Dioscorea cayennensis subsp. rotundata TaxID=55577 RepID=A0AB40CM01_DIOCR|nr:mitochondrial metalloendopeptidase OMA1-like [Dioscorea cayenensis subsp. rotundata]
MNFLRRSLPLLRRSIPSKIFSSPRPHLPLPPPLFSRSISNPNPTAGPIPNPSLSWRTILQPLALLIGVIVGGGGIIYYLYFETVPFSNNSRLVIVSPLAERKISEIEFQKLKNGLEGRILPANHPDTIRVRRISENIIEAIQPCLHHDKRQRGDLRYACEIQALERSPETRKKSAEAERWEVLVVSDKTFYAFCLPCRKIVVSTRVLDHLRTDAEIATLLGHEVAHVVARHGAEIATKDLWMDIYFRPSHFCRDPGELAYLHRKEDLCKRMEMEADHIGLLLMAYAGYDLSVAPRVYEKLKGINRKTLWHYSSREQIEVFLSMY